LINNKTQEIDEQEKKIQKLDEEMKQISLEKEKEIQNIKQNQKDDILRRKQKELTNLKIDSAGIDSFDKLKDIIKDETEKNKVDKKIQDEKRQKELNLIGVAISAAIAVLNSGSKAAEKTYEDKKTRIEHRQITQNQILEKLNKEKEALEQKLINGDEDIQLEIDKLTSTNDSLIHDKKVNDDKITKVKDDINIADKENVVALQKMKDEIKDNDGVQPVKKEIVEKIKKLRDINILKWYVESIPKSNYSYGPFDIIDVYNDVKKNRDEIKPLFDVFNLNIESNWTHSSQLLFVLNSKITDFDQVVKAKAEYDAKAKTAHEKAIADEKANAAQEKVAQEKETNIIKGNETNIIKGNELKQTTYVTGRSNVANLNSNAANKTNTKAANNPTPNAANNPTPNAANNPTPNAANNPNPKAAKSEKKTKFGTRRIPP
jgi:hypothetical protein